MPPVGQTVTVQMRGGQSQHLGRRGPQKLPQDYFTEKGDKAVKRCYPGAPDRQKYPGRTSDDPLLEGFIQSSRTDQRTPTGCCGKWILPTLDHRGSNSANSVTQCWRAASAFFATSQPVIIFPASGTAPGTGKPRSGIRVSQATRC